MAEPCDPAFSQSDIHHVIQVDIISSSRPYGHVLLCGHGVVGCVNDVELELSVKAA